MPELRVADVPFQNIYTHFTKKSARKIAKSALVRAGGEFSGSDWPYAYPGGGAYLIMSLHPTTHHRFPAILPFWSEICSFWPFSHTRGGVWVPKSHKIAISAIFSYGTPSFAKKSEKLELII